MKPISSWRDLEDYGIISLTGEADAYSLRILCDLTEEGKALIERFFSCKSMDLYSNWNRKGIASIMLPYGILEDLAKFVFYEQGAYGVMWSNGTIQGYEREEFEKHRELWRDDDFRLCYGIRFHTNPNYGKQGDRNLHHFSGRTY